MEAHAPREKPDMHPVIFCTIEGEVYYDILETRGWSEEAITEFRHNLELKCQDEITKTAEKLGYEATFPHETDWYRGGLCGISGCPTYWQGVVVGRLKKVEEDQP